MLRNIIDFLTPATMPTDSRWQPSFVVFCSYLESYSYIYMCVGLTGSDQVPDVCECAYMQGTALGAGNPAMSEPHRDLAPCHS